MKTKPRKTRTSWNEPGQAHFVTYSTFNQYPLLTKPRTRQWVLEAMESVRLNQDVAIWAYVIMPEHVHVLICPRRSNYEMRQILAGLKRPVSKNARAYLEDIGSNDWLKRLSTVRRRANGGTHSQFRFWLPGGGFDKNISSERSVREVVEYIHQNPVRRGLCDVSVDWRWSSARFWDGMTDVPISMDHPSDFSLTA